jgi:hypothetical protein
VQYLRDVAQNEDRLNVKAIKLILQVFLQSWLSIVDLDFHMAQRRQMQWKVSSVNDNRQQAEATTDFHVVFVATWIFGNNSRSRPRTHFPLACLSHHVSRIPTKLVVGSCGKLLRTIQTMLHKNHLRLVPHMTKEQEATTTSEYSSMWTRREFFDGPLVVSFISGDGPLSRHTDEFVRFRFSRRRRW